MLSAKWTSPLWTFHVTIQLLLYRITGSLILVPAIGHLIQNSEFQKLLVTLKLQAVHEKCIRWRLKSPLVSFIYFYCYWIDVLNEPQFKTHCWIQLHGPYRLYATLYHTSFGTILVILYHLWNTLQLIYNTVVCVALIWIYLGAGLAPTNNVWNPLYNTLILFVIRLIFHGLGKPLYYNDVPV